MIKIITIVGARPQIIKAAALSRTIENHFHDKIQEVIVHTGQHYDHNMSAVFFEELGIPEADYNLEIGSASHGRQTAQMISGIESVVEAEKPDAVILYGDTNSTLAGAIAVSKLYVPVIHIEAGLRSFNKKMPEEINRILCDHTSTLLFAPTQAAVRNLISEGFKTLNNPPFHIDNPGVFHCGDIMFDNSIYFGEMAEQKSGVIQTNQLNPGNYILTTIHRAENTDNAEKLQSIFNAILSIAEEEEKEFIIPLHPRTRKTMKKQLDEATIDRINKCSPVKIIEPVSFLDMILLEKNALMVMTDSGGVQKEAYFFQKPVIILRDETEWVEIVEAGAGVLTKSEQDKIVEAYSHFNKNRQINYQPLFGNGRAAEFICQTIVDKL